VKKRLQSNKDWSIFSGEIRDGQMGASAGVDIIQGLGAGNCDAVNSLEAQQ